MTITEELKSLLDTPIAMLTVKTRKRWNSLTQNQRNKAIAVLLYQVKRTGVKYLDDCWYNNAMNDADRV